jgi:hypothetical protein
MTVDDELDIDGAALEAERTVSEWYDDFEGGDRFSDLDGDHRGMADSIVMHLGHLMHTYLGLAPDEWDADGLEELLLQVAPEKVTGNERFFRAVGPVLEAFFGHLEDRGLQPNAAELAARARVLRRRLVRHAMDRRRWGPSKAMAMAAISEGVDLADPEQRESFLRRQRARMAGTAYGHPRGDERKVGRNAPCPCGSGKKYKRCCGKGRT